ncbi:MAG TPA: hypothetical protein VE641_07950 [Chthoniobacterales bacterium]|nr:hypothetical protein [Chthoniobacterales bacterium]
MELEFNLHRSYFDLDIGNYQTLLLTVVVVLFLWLLLAAEQGQSSLGFLPPNEDNIGR